MPFMVWHPEASGPCSSASFGKVSMVFIAVLPFSLPGKFSMEERITKHSSRKYYSMAPQWVVGMDSPRKHFPTEMEGKITAKEGNNCFRWNSLIFAGICSHIYSNVNFFTVLGFQTTWPFHQSGTNVLAICWFKCVSWVWFVFRQKQLTFLVSIFF